MDAEQSKIIIFESLQKDVSNAKVTEIDNEYLFGCLFEMDFFEIEIRTYKNCEAFKESIHDKIACFLSKVGDFD